MVTGENIKLEQSVEDIKKDVTVIKSALIGNEISGDGGLVGKVRLLQDDIGRLENEIKELNEARIKSSEYFKILAYITSVLFTALTGIVVKILFL